MKLKIMRSCLGVVLVCITASSWAGSPGSSSLLSMWDCIVQDMPVTDQAFQAHFFRCPSPTAQPAIMVLGGSEGGIKWAAYTSEILAQHGFAMLAVPYFKMPGLPPQLEEIPLEYFVTALRWLQAHPAVDAQRIGIVGASKGGELVLLLASMFPDFKAVVAFVPSIVVFQSIAPPSWPKTSSWSYQGKPLPFVPYVYPDNFRPNQLVTLYETSLAQPEAVKRAMIAVERINGPILFLTGKADTLWPATRMADMAVGRLRQYRFPFPVEHLAYDHAGHEISRVQKNPSTKRGGTVAGNGKAQHDAQKRMVTFFQTSLR